MKVDNMRRLSCSLLFVPLLVFAGCITMEDGGVKSQPEPRVFVVMWAQDGAEIVLRQTISQSTFRRQFLEHYLLKGERIHPPKDSTVVGLLVAHDETTIVTVPIWAWKPPNGETLFLCQASVDGNPPLFSANSHSEKDLLVQIENILGNASGSPM